jgi:DNA N-6-adenine-methyltransferase (Dam)
MSARLFGIDDALDSDAWYTPEWVFDGMGVTFDLDVAAPADGVPWLPAERHYSVADDGLNMPWSGWVWCNPPYSDPGPWCRRWAEHEPGGALLIRADLSTGGPFTAFAAATSIYVPRKRMQFVSGSGKPSGSVNFSTVILGRGDLIDDALHRLADTYGGRAAKFAQRCWEVVG